MIDNKKELPETTTSAQQSEGSVQPRKEDTSLRDVFNRFLEEDFFLEPFDFTRNNRLASLFNRQFVPRVDISETSAQVKVVADVAGADPDDIDINIENNRMSISGKTERESSPDERPYRYERTYGEFRRDFTLPTSVKKDEIKAVYKDGILTVTIPKAEGSKKEKIQIERQ
jgi:HSP20 family protein